MAKGIISSVNAGGSGGTILLTEQATVGPTGTGMSSPALSYGGSIGFNETLTAGISAGDLIGFDIADDPATGTITAVGISKLASGTMISGSASSVTIADGEAGLILNSAVNGNVSAGRGSTLMLFGSNSIAGKISSRGSSLVLIIGGTSSQKKGDIKGSIKIVIKSNDATFNEKFRIKNCREVTIDKNHFKDDLGIEECTNVEITNNVIDKDLEIEDTQQATVTGNTIGGDLELENVTTHVVENNTVSGSTEINTDDD